MKHELGSSNLTQRLQMMVRELVSRKGIRHAVVGVESMDRSFSWIGSAGEARPDGTLMTVETPFFIASVTKLYIAAAIMKLYEQRRVALDESVATYLPESLIEGIHRIGRVDYTDKITMRNLLSHTSGLPDFITEGPLHGRSLDERLVQDGDMPFDINDIVAVVRDQLAPHFRPQPAEARRQRARYSDTNYQLLIAVIETVTGMPLHQVLEEFIFRPLNLRHTWSPGYTALERTMEPATCWLGDRHIDDIPLAISSFRDLYSTVGDSLEFMRALVRGDAFNYSSTVGLMQQRWNSFAFSLDKAALRSPGWPIEYGLGLMRFRMPRFITPFRPMPLVIGHTGATGSWLFYCPQLDVLLCGTVDQYTAAALPYRFVPRLLRVLETYAK